MTAALMAVVAASSASAVTLTRHIAIPHGVTRGAEAHRIVVRTVAPPDRDDDGFADSSDGCPDKAGSEGGCPPAPTPAPAVSAGVRGSAPAPPSVAPAPVATSSGGCPSYMAAEASSPTAVNPSSGAAGCFQILPSTQAAYGCSDVGADCAARICADVGNAAWAASGSTPCDYLGRP